MKLFAFIILILAPLFSPQLFGQKCSDDIFKIEIKSNTPDEIEINYYDVNWDKYKSSIKFNSSEASDKLYSMEYVSLDKKNNIESLIFNVRELDTLKRGIAVCKIHIPSGKIVSISFLLQNNIEVFKMKKLKQELEQKTYFKIQLYAELEREGYITQSFPIFVSRRKRINFHQ